MNSRRKLYSILIVVLFVVFGFGTIILSLPLASAQSPTPDLSRNELIKLIAIAPSTGLNLRGVNLAGENLSNLDLTNARLSGGNFRDTISDNLILENARAMNADFSRANLSNAVLEGVRFDWSNLADTNFENALLINAYFRNADLTGANLRGANLEGAIMPNGEFYIEGMDLMQFVNPD